MTDTSSYGRTVGSIVTERPGAARVLERLGIDYCCGGKKPLSEACAAKGLDVDNVLRQIDEERSRAGPPERDWSRGSMTELVDHIEATHHASMKRELPRLGQIVRKVASVHGGRHVELREVASIFQEFALEMESHMMKEEQVLFPAIRRMETGGPAMSLDAPIASMMHEHDHAGRALETMRALTNNYVPPPEACNTYRVMLGSLAEMETDLHLHVHKENNILFPRAAGFR
jgi:regulator of cell morphogenesis and NO signaling